MEDFHITDREWFSTQKNIAELQIWRVQMESRISQLEVYNKIQIYIAGAGLTGIITLIIGLLFK